MGYRIVVATDFSANSKAAIRFALQLEKKGKKELVFYHVLPFLKPTRWSDARYAAYAQKEKEDSGRKLLVFIKEIYQSAGIKNENIRCVVQHRPDVQEAIIAYARGIQAYGICMGMRGAGLLKKIIGTNASGIISRTPVPVFVVPGRYRRSPIKHILYSSDLNQIGGELKKVRAVAAALNAKISVYHYDYLADVDEARKKLEKTARRYQSPEVTFNFKKYHIDKPLAAHLLEDMRTSKASLAVLFTDQERGWFDKVFLPSKSADVALLSKIPLMIFPKAQAGTAERRS